jgi:hypothetical protein
MSMLLPSPVMSRGPCPTDEGSRVGLIYVPRTPELADMHFIINGEDQGPCCREIPYGAGPLYAVVDIYGSTKQVRLIQLYQGGLSASSLFCSGFKEFVFVSSAKTAEYLPRSYFTNDFECCRQQIADTACAERLPSLPDVGIVELFLITT